MSISSRLGISCTAGIIQIWLEFTVKYTCYSFTFISFQYFRPIHLTLNDLLVTFPATFHNSFLLYFHNWPVFSVSSVPGPTFCSKKEKKSFTIQLIYAVFWLLFFSFALHSLHQCVQASSSENQIHVLTEHSLLKKSRKNSFNQGNCFQKNFLSWISLTLCLFKHR